MSVRELRTGLAGVINAAGARGQVTFVTSRTRRVAAVVSVAAAERAAADLRADQDAAAALCTTNVRSGVMSGRHWHPATHPRSRAGTPVPAARDGLIAVAVDEARGEVGRADGKAGTLLTLATAALAALVTFAHAHIPPAAAVLLWLAAVSAGAAVWVLLNAIRPRLGGPARMLADHAALLEDGTDLPGWQARRLRLLSGTAAVKYRRIRFATDLLMAALGLLAVAVPLVITGGA